MEEQNYFLVAAMVPRPQIMIPGREKIDQGLLVAILNLSLSLCEPTLATETKSTMQTIKSNLF